MNIRKGLSLPTHLYDHYATLPNERLLLASRTHPYTLALPGIGIATGWLGFSGVLLALFHNGYIAILHTILSITLFTLLAGIACIVLFLLWRSHYYIVTNRKMIEVRGFPLFFRTVNDVLLDRVRCTEIDIRRQGFIHTLLNLGDIIITFDRPTHQEEFAITDIHDPDHVGLFLSDMLESTRDLSASPVWSKNAHGNNYHLTEEIFPERPLLTGAIG